PRMDELDPARDMPRLVQYTCPWSLVGVPAISVPAGLAADGLPVGLQLVGRPCDELTVLHAAHAYQTATDWHERRPPAARARAGASASNPHE
ncbi:MAG TPA: amidase family protein, partial [Conexibacter sp.]|nr:amidase family protein [Conexibacter sp.]